MTYFKYHLSEGPIFKLWTQNLNKGENRRKNDFLKYSLNSFSAPDLYDACQISEKVLNDNPNKQLYQQSYISVRKRIFIPPLLKIQFF
jgi:hypothetical protein